MQIRGSALPPDTGALPHARRDFFAGIIAVVDEAGLTGAAPVVEIDIICAQLQIGVLSRERPNAGLYARQRL